MRRVKFRHLMAHWPRFVAQHLPPLKRFHKPVSCRFVCDREVWTFRERHHTRRFIARFRVSTFRVR